MVTKTRAERRREERRIRKGLPLEAPVRAPEPEWDHCIMVRSRSTPVARKTYSCMCSGDLGHCGTVIRPGDQYVRLKTLDTDAIGPRGRRGRYGVLILCERCGR